MACVFILIADRLFFARFVDRMVHGRMDPNEPEIGDVWEFTKGGSSDPWGGKCHRVTVLDVRAGWVRYDLLDSRMEADKFRRMYRKVQ
jgi:hypothetical protein